MTQGFIADDCIRGQRFRLVDLLAPGAKPIVSNKKIEDCEIYGPAMIALIGGDILNDNRFDGDLDSLFVEVPEERTIIGAVGLQDCEFHRCHFVAVGIIGTRKQIEKVKRGFKIEGGRK